MFYKDLYNHQSILVAQYYYLILELFSTNYYPLLKRYRYICIRLHFGLGSNNYNYNYNNIYWIILLEHNSMI
jgi:hypothetical protein